MNNAVLKYKILITYAVWLSKSQIHLTSVIAKDGLKNEQNLVNINLKNQ